MAYFIAGFAAGFTLTVIALAAIAATVTGRNGVER